MCTVDRDILDLAARKRAVNERVMASGDPLDEVGAEAAPDAASVAAALSKALEEYRTANAEADDLEIGPQKSAEELLRERERLAEARGDVVGRRRGRRRPRCRRYRCGEAEAISCGRPRRHIQ